MVTNNFVFLNRILFEAFWSAQIKFQTRSLIVPSKNLQAQISVVVPVVDQYFAQHTYRLRYHSTLAITTLNTYKL